MEIAPYGSWKSPITLDALVERTVGFGFPLATSRFTYWSELRPAEGGRTVIMRQPNDKGGLGEDVFGTRFNARSLAHEYGGLSYIVHPNDTVYFSNFADQRLYRISAGAAEPQPITAEPPSERSVRYAAPTLTPNGRYIVTVRERHPAPDDPARVLNDLVVLPTDGSRGPTVLADGHDFFGQPALSPDGSRVAWSCWDHPNMPWDGTGLWEVDLEGRHVAGDAPARCRSTERVGGTAQVQPRRQAPLRVGPDRLVEPLRRRSVRSDQPRPDGSRPR